MSVAYAFSVGLLGALFIYAVRFRQQRLKDVLAFPRENWKMVVFDVVVFILLGGVFVAFIIQPDSPREAFLAGATWEGAATSLIPTKEKP